MSQLENKFYADLWWENKLYVDCGKCKWQNIKPISGDVKGGIDKGVGFGEGTSILGIFGFQIDTKSKLDNQIPDNLLFSLYTFDQSKNPFPINPIYHHSTLNQIHITLPQHFLLIFRIPIHFNKPHRHPIMFWTYVQMIFLHPDRFLFVLNFKRLKVDTMCLLI